MSHPAEASPESAELVLVPKEDGLIVSGPAAVVELIVAELVRVGGSGVSASGPAPVAGVLEVTDAAALAASGGAVALASCEYVRHTARSLALLREHGLVPSQEGGGAFRSFVFDKSGHFGGNLDWVPANFGPERALAIQTAAVGLALRTAIKQVEQAVERVEGKVERIAKLVRAERLGTAVGNHRTLSALAARVRADRSISATDWSSVAGLGPAIVEDIEALRAYVRSELSEADGGWRTRGRADDAVELLEDDLLPESMGLLVVAEHNLALWQDLRVANVREREPEHLDSVVTDSWESLRAQRTDDQALLDGLRLVVESLTAPAMHDGLAPLQSQRLNGATQRLDELATWFAEQRALDIELAARVARPGVRDSVEHIAGEVSTRASTMVSKLRRRGGDAQPELPRPKPPF